MSIKKLSEIGIKHIKFLNVLFVRTKINLRIFNPENKDMID